MEGVKKGDFLDVLKQTDAKIVNQVNRNHSKQNLSYVINSYYTLTPLFLQKSDNAGKSDDPTWSILKDDFMMGAKMKDWDKESDDSGNEEEAMDQGQDDSDTDS